MTVKAMKKRAAAVLADSPVLTSSSKTWAALMPVRRGTPMVMRSESVANTNGDVGDLDGMADKEDGEDEWLPGTSWLNIDDELELGASDNAIDESQKYDVLKLPTNIMCKDMLLYIIGTYEVELGAFAQFKVCHLDIVLVSIEFH